MTVKKDNLKDNIKKASEFIETCITQSKDENETRPLEEIINEKKQELPSEVLELVECATVCDSEKGLSNPLFTGNKVPEDDECECECDCDSDKGSIKTALLAASSLKHEYRNKKRELKAEQARLRLETDWSTIIEGKTRPSNDDKDAWILLETLPLQEEVDELEGLSQHAMELFKVEKLLLQL